MALTATACNKNSTANILSMHAPVTTLQSQNNNVCSLFLFFHQRNIWDTTTTFKEGHYVRYEDSADLYILPKRFYNSPDYSRFRSVEMFTRCTDAEVKSEILHSFTSMQESGAGRNGVPALALLLKKKGITHTNKSMLKINTETMWIPVVEI